MMLVQLYVPNENEKQDEKNRFYERVDQVIEEYRKGREFLVMLGEFNGRVGNNRYEDTVGLFGLGERTDNEEKLVNFCKMHNLFVTNTWFQQRTSAQHTWISPDKKTKNQIDYILVDKRFRNGVLNSKSMPGDKRFRNGVLNSRSMPGAHCGSDHKPVLATLKIKLQRARKTKKAIRYNISQLKKPETREAYRLKLENQLQEGKFDQDMEIDDILKKLKESIKIVTEKICRKEKLAKKQSWMNTDILKRWKK